MDMYDVYSGNLPYRDNQIIDTNQLLNDYIKKRIKEYDKSVSDLLNAKSLDIEPNTESENNKDVSKTKENNVDPSLVVKKSPASTVYINTATGKRLTPDERTAYETDQYQQQKQQSNNEVIRNVLIGTGVLGAGALLSRKALSRGAELAKDYHLSREVGKTYENLEEYLKTRPSVIDPRFWAATIGDTAAKAEQETRLKELYSNPLKAIGALGYRLGLDVVTDGTRSRYWRYNHPLAIASSAAGRLVDPLQALSPTQKSVLTFSAALPAIAASGAYDITNPAELFRPEGYKQNIPDPENPRESTEPVTELFQRFFMGRTGRPLKYSEAKKDIPDLTPERYTEYLRHTYQDKGLLDLGIIKGTEENLQGVPELRMLGYPVTIPMVTMASLGALGSGLATSLTEYQYKNKMEKLVRQKMDIQDIPGTTQKSYVKYIPEILVDQSTGKVVQTDRYIPSSKRVIVNSDSGIPDPRSRSIINKYIGAKPDLIKTRQLLSGLGGIAAGTTAGYFLGNYINQAIADSKNNPSELLSTEEYGVS
jgi:23S rRNA pseudoU1915 N3-methylase RlmH